MTTPVDSEPSLPEAADGEIRELRSETSSTFERADGSFETVTATQPVHFLDDTGSWQQIDNSLVPVDGGGSETKAADVVLAVPDSLESAPIRLATDDEWVGTQLVGASGPVIVDGATATVSDALPGVDVVQTSTTTGTKEDLVLASPAAGSSFSYRLTTSTGLTPRLAADGSVKIVDEDGGVSFVLVKPFMDDAVGAHSDAVSYTVAPDARAAGTWLLTVAADASWLAADQRVYPVRIDPTTYSTGGSGGLSCTVRSDSASTSYCGGPTVDVGTSGSGQRRALLDFSDVDTKIPADAMIVQGRLSLPLTALSTSSPVNVEVRANLSSFSSSTTWNTKPANGSAVYRRDIAPGDVGGPERVYLTQIVKDWASGAYGWNGVTVKATTEPAAGYASFAGVGSQIACLPQSCDVTELAITWEERLGQAPAQQFFDRRITDRQSIQVNLANGNLLVTSEELAGITRTYNSLRVDKTGRLGRAWVLDTGGDVRVEDAPDGSIRYYAPSGTQYTFIQRLDGTYIDPAGLRARARKETVSGEGLRIFLKFLDTDTELKFDATTGEFLSAKDRNGNVIQSFTYSGGRLTTFRDVAGRVTTATHTGVYLTKLVDTAGRQTDYTITGDRLVSAKDAAGKTTTYSYDSSNRITRITDPTGDPVKVTYDSSNRVTSLTQVNNTGADTGPTTTFTYDRIDLPVVTGGSARGTTVVRDANSHNTTYTWDVSGQVTKVVDALNHQRTAEYGPDSNVAFSVDALGVGGVPGNQTAYEYNTNFSPTKMTMPTGASTTLTYNTSAGSLQPYLPASSRDAQGKVTTLTYDGPGNLTKSQDTTTGPTGGVARSFAYNPKPPAALICGGRPGQLCSETDGNNRITRYGYNSAGDLTSITRPSPRPVETFAYDSLGRVTSRRDGKGLVTKYTYDAVDRVTQTRLNDSATCTSTDVTGGRCVTYTYDDDGNLTGLGDRTGSTSFGYDRLDRQTSTTQPGIGTPLSVTYDAVGNNLTYTDGSGTVSYRYNNDNTVRDAAEPGGSCTATPTVLCTTFGYNANTFRTSTTYPGGTVMSVTPDASGRVGRIKAARGGSTLYDYTYSYAATSGCSGSTGCDRSLVQSRTDLVGLGAGANTTIRYSYDNLSRLTNATEKNGGGTTTASWAYGYDPVGNLLSKITTGVAVPENTTFGYNGADQLVSRNGTVTGWSYDANGNELTGRTSTGANRSGSQYSISDALTGLTTPSGTSTFTYAGLGNSRRVTLTALGQTTEFQVGQLQVTSQRVGTSSSAPVARYTRTPDGTLLSMRQTTGTSAGSLYYLFDGQGSVVGLVNGSGSLVTSYSYSPYGETRATSGSTGTISNPWRYTGGYADLTTGLYKFGARYYDPTIGRFTQPDPSGQDANDYLYALANSVNFVDPRGTFPQGLGATLGGVAGIAVATVGIGLACAGTAGVGCVVAASVIAGSIGGGGGAFVGSALAGGNADQNLGAARDGAIGGVLGLGVLGNSARLIRGV